MTTVKITKTYTALNGQTYKRGDKLQLRTREASALVEAGAAKLLGYKGR